jgi:uncharacterized integral membrane protein
MVVALRRLAIVAIAAIAVLVAAVFAYGNQEPVDVDVGVLILEDVSLTVVLTVTFVLGACFGGLFSVGAMLKHLRERRLLRRELRRTETELQSLRSLSLPDAD